MKLWLKSGLILAALTFILDLLVIATSHPRDAEMFALGFPNFFAALLLVPFGEIGNMAAFIIIGALINFCIGALIGLVIQKIKQKP